MTYPTLDLRKDRVRQGDFKEALWMQYVSTLNSLKVQNATSTGHDGDSRFESYPSWETFVGNVDILESMCLGYDLLDDEYEKRLTPHVTVRKVWGSFRDCPHTNPDCSCREVEETHPPLPTTKFAALTHLLKRKVFAEKFEDLGHV